MACAMATLLILLAGRALAQQPTIEVRKVRTLVDMDGKGFTRAPVTITPIAGGRFALAELDEVPLVVDSTGRLVKRFARGRGPGEIPGDASVVAAGPADSIVVATSGHILIFDRDLKFARSIIGISANGLVPVRDGYVTSAQTYAGRGLVSMVGLIDRSGTRVRFFINDTGTYTPGAPPPSSHIIGIADGESFWAATSHGHRLEHWGIDGTPRRVIDQLPPWFVPPRTRAPSPRVRSLREADGVLWVMSAVAVPNAEEILRENDRKRGGETLVRALPLEQLTSTHLEAYDVNTGRLLADLPIKAFGVAILDGSHFMLYTTSANDAAQLEIWEMKLKR
jgi:hypothetical protein